MSARIVETETLYSGWTRLLRLTICEGETRYTREVEDHGDAACVLPFDPERGCVLLVRLLRAPMLRAGNGERDAGMSVEAPAGLTDGKDAADAARREALEEAGVKLGPLDPVATAWSSPGISTERISLFLAEYRRTDRIAAGGGLAEEHENIEVLEMPLDELWSLYRAGDVTDLKTLALLLALRERRPDLFDFGTSGDVWES